MRISIIIAAVLIVLVIPLVVLCSAPKPDFNDPSFWFEKQGDFYVLDVFTATSGYGEYSSEGIHFTYDEIDTLFAIESYYRGEEFSQVYPASNTVMSAIPAFNPTDGVLNVFVLERVEQGVWMTYFFVDEDYKKRFTPAIFYGDKYNLSKPFEFREVVNGVYYDVVIDDASRFSGGTHSPGPMMGDISREDTVEKTVIRIV